MATAAFQALPDAAVILDASGTIIESNIAWRTFSADNGGDPHATGVGTNYLEVCERAADHNCMDAAEFAAGLHAVLAGERFDVQLEYVCASPGSRRTMLARANRLHGDLRGAIVTHVDITSTRISRDSERPLSTLVDPLCGLATQEVFQSRLGAALAAGRCRTGARRWTGVADIGVIRIELDGITMVADTFGHPARALVLQQIAYRLGRTKRRGDTLARFGATGMAVLAPDVNATELAALVGQLQRVVDEPHALMGRLVPVSVHISSYLASVGDAVPDALRAAARRSADQLGR
jgi:diguanylate cyclase (GGDEF)-like protein